MLLVGMFSDNREGQTKYDELESTIGDDNYSDVVEAIETVAMNAGRG